MKRIALLTAMLLLICTLCLTASAAENPVGDAIGGLLEDANNGENPLSNADLPDIPGLPKSEEDGAQDESPDDAASDPTVSEQETAAETDADTAAPTDAPTAAPTQPSSQQATLTPERAKAEEDSADHMTAIIVIVICGAVLLILLIVAVGLLLMRKKPSGADAPVRSGSVRGIPVRIEVLSGLCYNAELNFHLRRNLTIGSDSGCDLVFEDPQMLPMHAVITRASGGVTVGECADTGNTYVGGMKIFAPNRLRSGDIVTIGSTAFRVFFDK